MTKYVKAYLELINDFIKNKAPSASSEETDAALEELQMKILYFQHERLIHLIVTELFAILEVMMICLDLVYPTIHSVLLSVMFMALLIPYIFHYYFLENSVQSLYKIRDELISLKNTNADKA